MKQGGFDKSKIHILCNFIDVKKTIRQEYNKQDYYCFIGRLSHEKGGATLVKAARQLPYKLRIIGGGPLMDELKTLAAGTDIEFWAINNGRRLRNWWGVLALALFLRSGTKTIHFR